MCDSEDKLYLGALIKSIGRSQNLGFRTLKVKQTNPHKPKRVLFPIIPFCSLSVLFLPHSSTTLLSFSLLSPFQEGPSLNPREGGRSLGWRGRGGNPCSDPGQFNYPVFFRCATRVPISQPTPLMRPGLASLTFNDLPIDALGPTARARTHTHTHTLMRTHAQTRKGKFLSFSVKEFTKQFC